MGGMTTMTLAKNWRTIAQIPNAHLKLFFALTTEGELLERAASAFPEFFLANADSPAKFSLSLLRQLADRFMESGQPDRSTIDKELATAIGLPSVTCMPNDSEFFKLAPRLPMPQNLAERYGDL